MRSVVIAWATTTGRATRRSDGRCGHGHLRDARPRVHQVADLGRDAPGTFLGVIEKIPYLQELGRDGGRAPAGLRVRRGRGPRDNPLDGPQLGNYWGYSPIGFFPPHAGYCVEPDEGSHIREFRDMVKALHKAGIEVILDVVFNHTGEGNHKGPTISFKGLANSTYYHLEPTDQQYYMDYSGCGNTFNGNHPIVEKFIVECLDYWVRRCTSTASASTSGRC